MWGNTTNEKQLKENSSFWLTVLCCRDARQQDERSHLNHIRETERGNTRGEQDHLLLKVASCRDTLLLTRSLLLKSLWPPPNSATNQGLRVHAHTRDISHSDQIGHLQGGTAIGNTSYSNHQSSNIVSPRLMEEEPRGWRREKGSTFFFVCWNRETHLRLWDTADFCTFVWVRSRRHQNPMANVMLQNPFIHLCIHSMLSHEHLLRTSYQ